MSIFELAAHCLGFVARSQPEPSAERRDIIGLRARDDLGCPGAKLPRQSSVHCRRRHRHATSSACGSNSIHSMSIEKTRSITAGNRVQSCDRVVTGMRKEEETAE